MRIQVRLFAVARQLVGSDEVEVELPEGSTLGDLRGALAVRWPDLATVLPQVMFAINSEYATDAAAIPGDSEVACIPPVSGG